MSMSVSKVQTFRERAGTLQIECGIARDEVVSNIVGLPAVSRSPRLGLYSNEGTEVSTSNGEELAFRRSKRNSHSKGDPRDEK